MQLLLRLLGSFSLTAARHSCYCLCLGLFCGVGFSAVSSEAAEISAALPSLVACLDRWQQVASVARVSQLIIFCLPP